MERNVQSDVDFRWYSVPFVDMKFEQSRLDTFTRGHWGEAMGNPPELAKAGLFYRDKKLRCYVCNLEFASWNPEDVPMDVHRERNPHCNFVKGDAENVPMRVPAEAAVSIPGWMRGGYGVDQVIG